MGQKCSHCDEEDYPAYTCNYCDFVYCSAHRLPENHNCPGLSTSESHSPPLESDAPTTLGQTSDLTERQRDDSEKSPEPREISGDLPSAAKDPPTSSSPPVETKDSNDGETISNVSETQSLTGVGKQISDAIATVLFIPIYFTTKLLSLFKTIVRFFLSPRILLSGIIALVVLSATLGTGIQGIDNTVDDTLDAGSGVLANVTDETSDTVSDGGSQASPSSQGDIDVRKVEEEIHRRINERRAKHDLRSLHHDSELRSIASSHSR